VAWGRKNRLAWEIHGTTGTLAFDQERLNELQIFVNDGPADTRGFRSILTGPLHPPYSAFCPAAGHGLGFGDLKTIEAAQFLRSIAGGPPAPFSFAEGLQVERAIHGIAESAASGRWITLPQRLNAASRGAS
jgi:predicted dehydrogenase